jgi:predicted Holliday junction resolvase-like endonuclease
LLVGFLLAKLIFFVSISKERKQAIKQSKATSFGYVSEAIAPLSNDFPYHIKDIQFLGKWVDYIVFDWLHEGNLRAIRFLEIKTNKSQLNHHEKMIQQAVANKAVSYEILRITQNNKQ